LYFFFSAFNFCPNLASNIYCFDFFFKLMIDFTYSLIQLSSYYSYHEKSLKY